MYMYFIIVKKGHTEFSFFSRLVIQSIVKVKQSLSCIFMIM